jgi:hypothetical protein
MASSAVAAREDDPARGGRVEHDADDDTVEVQIGIAAIAARTTYRDREQVSANVVWLRRLQSDEHRDAGGYLPRLLQLFRDEQGREDAGDRLGLAKGKVDLEDINYF